MEFPELDCSLENKLVERLEAFADMVTRKKQIQDVLFTIHGKTGSGKTNTAVILSYKLKMLIPERDVNLFFSTGKAAEFAKKTKEKIIIIDEPSFDSLSKDQMTKVSKDFFRLLNTMRQKRHIVMVAITRFWRFPFDLVVDRALAMINMYDKDGKDPGRFHYLRQRSLERLWDDYSKFKQKNFGKYKAFGGWMPERMETLDGSGVPYFNRMGINIEGKPNCTYDDYKDLRDKAIASIGVETIKTKKELEIEKKLKEIRFKVSLLNKTFNITQQLLAKHFGIHRRTLIEWQNYGQNMAFPLEKVDFEESSGDSIVNSMGYNQNNHYITIEKDTIIEEIGQKMIENEHKQLIAGTNN